MANKYTVLFGLMTLCYLQNTHTVVQWSGSSMPDVLDEDLVIEGNCQMPYQANVLVAAHNADVTITLTHDAIIQANSSNDDNVNHTIFLEALYPYTITIQVSHKLTFKGAAGNLTNQLEVCEQGNGNIQWVFEDDSDAKVRFLSDETSGGAELWICFATIFPLSSPTTPNHSFETTRAGQIRFGHRCKWGYRVFSNYDSNGNIVFEHNDESKVGFADLSNFALQIFTF